MVGIKPFDPWKSKLCTCPKKYVINPYTGCGHRCLYCYASAYIRNFFLPRPKRGIVEAVKRDLEKLEPGIVMVSASTDPYQPLERKLKITREILKLLIDHDWKIELVTKSDLFLRDKRLLEEGNVVLSVTITTPKDDLAAKLEPGAPPPSRRIEALAQINLPKVVRIDPLIPSINLRIQDVLLLLDHLEKVGVSHIVFSTYKARPDSLKRLFLAFPERAGILRELYLKNGMKISNYYYLPFEMRFRVLKFLEELAIQKGFTVGFCREGIKFSGPSCDGSHLFK